MRKENNDRKYPKVRGWRPDLKKLRKHTADENQKAYDKLTTQQKLDKLDEVLGKGVGAKKQRARLLKLLEGKNSGV